MIFSSILFLYFFLPVFMGIYGLAKPKHRAKALALGSCFFTAWENPWGLINLAVSGICAYIGGILIYNFRENRRKSGAAMIICAAVNAAMLVFFSYSGYDRTSLIGAALGRDTVLPFSAFGVSVYTLHSISYCADIYRGSLEPDIKFSCVFSYTAFIPSMVCGPVVRYKELSESLKAPRITSGKLSDGILLFMFGLFEKTAVSDRLGFLWKDMTSAGAESMQLETAWLGLLIFGFWFYFEFLGFSHMARGFALMLGFELKPNFKLPFTEKTIIGFASSFNISLNRWAKDYIYDSFTKNKDSRVINSAKLLLCAAAVGLWYGTGVNFILWSVFTALLILAESGLKNILSRIPSAVRFIMTQLSVLLSWSVLSGKDLHSTFGYIRALFRLEAVSGGDTVWYWLKSSFVLIVLCMLLASPLMKLLNSKLRDLKFDVISFSKPMIILALLILCTAFMVSGNGKAAFAF
ncbi:MBOAT family O-acyltransferase [Ruminococcus sp. Marseille-P6503]|uniref:MBOAT family O-acyltransferase n=1 Tax=Ruminococcus sp. Marseille-P6503 TaxID=2364796 RepID=UPI000F525175|nr:MBOAT family O-acyltransferase [Ruminococcus sp. Marseille-P6503]